MVDNLELGADYGEIMATVSFAGRVRDLLDSKGLTLAQLAERAELLPSLLSKLLTDTDASRREPRLEHVLAIARGLEIAPRELVLGTTVEALLGEWIPRDEFEAESKARTAAQTEAAQLRTELAGKRSELNSLSATVEELLAQRSLLASQLAQMEIEVRGERAARQAVEAKLQAAMSERDQALALAETNYQAWANARSGVLQAQRELAKEKGAGWKMALLGAVGGAMLSAAAAESGDSAIATTPRRRTRRAR